MTADSGGAATATLVLRPFVASDLPAVLAIEQLSSPSPWKGEFFLKELRHQYSRVLVAEFGGLLVGYLCRWFVVDEIQILNVAVHPQYRQRGIGRALLRDIFAEAHQRDVRSLSLEVRTSNTAAINLYEEFGFHQVTVRHRYYEDGEDALVMVCNVVEQAG